MISRLNYLVLFLFLLACTPQKKQINNPGSKSSIRVDIEANNFKDSANIRFLVKNISSGQLFIHNHKQLHIERLDNNNWIKLRILNCPCGAPCSKPIEFIEIAKDGDLLLKWGKEESWCGNKNSYGIPETIRLKAPIGKYRLKVIFSRDGKDTEVYYKEFNV